MDAHASGSCRFSANPLRLKSSSARTHAAPATVEKRDWRKAKPIPGNHRDFKLRMWICVKGTQHGEASTHGTTMLVFK